MFTYGSDNARAKPVAFLLFIGFSMALSAAPVAGVSLQPLEEDEMASVSGTGLAFAFDDFRFQAAPTSYIEQTGGEPGAGTSFKRGDLRWFGATASNWSATEAASERTTWSGTCGNGLNNMGCPLSTEGIANYSNHDNPFVLRVFEYQRVGLNAAGNDWVGDPVAGGVSPGGVNRTVLELLGPSDSQRWRWAFWGEIQASTTDGSGNIDTVLGTLRNQNLIIGKPAAHVRPPSVFGTGPTNPVDGAVLQLFQYRGQRINGAGVPFLDESLGLIYQSRLSGDYRLSVNQIAGALDSDPVPRFSNQEGLYFTNVNAYLPLGQLYYQAIVLDSVNPGTGAAGDGNFIIELTRIPNDPNVYNDFYRTTGQNGYQRADRDDRYYQTHGYVEWGSYFPTTPGGNGLPAAGTNDGVRFSGPGYTTGTQSVSLPARAINVTNFPGPLCGSGRDDVCDLYTGTAAAVTVPLNSPSIAGTSTRQQVAQAGGMAFVSRDAASTWGVRNRQNDNVDLIVFNRDVMVWRTARQSVSCGLFCSNERLQAPGTNPPNPAGAPAVLRNLSPVVQVNAINLGSSRVEGLLVQHMKITSLGAAP